MLFHALRGNARLNPQPGKSRPSIREIHQSEAMHFEEGAFVLRARKPKKLATSVVIPLMIIVNAV